MFNCHLIYCNFCFRKLEVRGYPLNVGGVFDIKTILQGLNQVSTYDFVGCVRELSINGVDLTRDDALQSSGVIDGCPRSGPQSPCAGDICKNDATCHDEWDRVQCNCLAGFMGPTCEQGNLIKTDCIFFFNSM